MNFILFALLALADSRQSETPRPLARSEKERSCYARERVYHSDTDDCYKLLTQGPCRSGEWLVLQKPTDYGERRLKIRPMCAQERCGPGQYYWNEKGMCVKSSDKYQLCSYPEEEELRYNVFGDAECECAREPPRARLHNRREERCHLLYSRGPCRPREILGFRSEESDDPACVPDPCHSETRGLEPSKITTEDGVLALWEDGKCYELGTQGPCPDDFTFKIDTHYLTPSCVSLTNSIFKPEKNCFADEYGNCQTEVKFKNQILNLLRAFRRQRSQS